MKHTAELDTNGETPFKTIDHPGRPLHLYTILLLSLVLSNPVLLRAGSDVVPYEPGTRQELPSAGARIYEISCVPTYGGTRFSFRLEVFETCWEPVYGFALEETEGTRIEPVSCPNGWTAVQVPDALYGPGRLVFSTDTRPIGPGANLGGFSLLSRSPATVIRWYPTGSAETLIGRVTRQEFSCPTESETETWGSVKALYR